MVLLDICTVLSGNVCIGFYCEGKAMYGKCLMWSRFDRCEETEYDRFKLFGAARTIYNVKGRGYC